MYFYLWHHMSKFPPAGDSLRAVHSTLGHQQKQFYISNPLLLKKCRTECQHGLRNSYSSHIMVQITRGDPEKLGFEITPLMNSRNFFRYTNKVIFLGSRLKIEDKTFKSLLLLITCNHFFSIPITFAVCKARCKI